MAAFCIVMSGSVPALAASSTVAKGEPLTPAQIEQRRQAMLVEMMARPNDLDLAFEYVKLSKMVGDLEGAVSTLERMLIYQPNTPQIQLELGILYYKLGAYEVSRNYLQQAKVNPATPPEIAQQVQIYIEQLDVTAEPEPFSGSIYTGIRWESNANTGPANNTVTLNGIDFTLDDQAVGRSGWSNLTIGNLHYSHDRERQGDTIEFDFTTYNSWYFDDVLQDINLNFFEATLGPSYNLKRWGMPKSRGYVYAIGDLAYLGNDYYFSAPGAGLRLTSFAADRAFLDARLETRVREFNDTAELPTASLRDGPQTRFGLTYSYITAPGVVLTTQGYAQREDVTADFYSNWEIALSGGVAWTFANPLWTGRYPWTWQVGAGVIRRDYDSPDPTIDPTASEEDTTFWGRTAMILPVAETWALIPQVEYRDQSSNYDIRDFDDLSLIFGIQKTF
ncbi:tetratricopeptide repeat protein [Methyloligella solikamskensis]|uniref:Tetratricopeptide repeat protein n=1 Tax=Methyloligella solikamskensis TaxID=1177756 RepID=A0ABW3JAR3_9HYPH